MKSRATPRFWTAYYELPVETRELARKAYALFRDNPAHPSLNFKRVHTYEPVYSVRVARGYRALGLLENDEITWFWIGSHAGYDRSLQPCSRCPVATTFGTSLWSAMLVDSALQRSKAAGLSQPPTSWI